MDAYEDGAPALDLADFGELDLLITDMRMPTPGAEVIRTVRERGFELPILVVSASVREEEALELASMGVEGILEKPFDVKRLMDDVGRLLRRPLATTR